MLDNLPWHALHTEHARFAMMRQLASLLAPGETIYLMGDPPEVVPELVYGEIFPCLQMTSPASVAPESQDAGVVGLTCDDAAAMVGLTDVAFPGFFRARTCEMGSYFGMFDGDELVAMGGERLVVPDWREISGVCTRPGYTGRGYAARLITRLLREHAGAGMDSFLLVNRANTRAIGLYAHLGFSLRREIPRNSSGGREGAIAETPKNFHFRPGALLKNLAV